MNVKISQEKVNKHVFPKNQIFQIKCSENVLNDDKLIN